MKAAKKKRGSSKSQPVRGKSWLNRKKRRKSSLGSLGFENLEDRKLMAGVIGNEATAISSQLADTIQVAHTDQIEQNQNQTPQDFVQRIVNGEQTSDYPAVGFVGPLGCTGTLISPTHVLTAAHCLEGIGNSQAVFEVNGQSYQSSQVTLHPDYDANDFGAGNDIAIIELNRTVDGVQPMQIFRQVPQVGTLLTLVGFGEGGTSTGGFDPNDTGKQVGETTLEGVTEEHITWNFDSHDEANTAPGDSGGPAFIKVNNQQFIAGVTSGGSGDAHQLGDFSFDTRVDVHADWIDSLVGSTDPGDPGDPGDPPGGKDDHVNEPGATATKINLDAAGKGTGTGDLEVEGDRDAFQFTITEAGETTISLSEAGSGVDTYLRIYDSGGNLIHENDDAGGSFNSQLKVDLQEGTYFAVAGAYADNGTGAFRMDVQHVADDSDGGGGDDGNQDGVFSNNQSQEISDTGRDRVVSDIFVEGLDGEVTDVNVTVDIEHTYTSDLRLILIAPDGTRVVLANREGGGGNDFAGTVFDQSADTRIRQGDAPFQGTFRPIHSLDRVNGVEANGRWRLIIHDFVDLDGGRLNNWSVEISTNASRSRVIDSASDAWQAALNPVVDSQAQTSDVGAATDSLEDAAAPELAAEAVAVFDSAMFNFDCFVDVGDSDNIAEGEGEEGELQLAGMDSFFASQSIGEDFQYWS